VKAWGEAHRAEPQVIAPTNLAALQGRDQARAHAQFLTLRSLKAATL
jgi:hypothetical protein